MTLQTPLLQPKERPSDPLRFPEDLSLYASLSFDWVSPLMDKGYRRPLQDGDIYQLPEWDRCFGITCRLEEYFNELKPSLFQVLTREWCWPTVKAGLWKILNDASQFTGPIFMSQILRGLTEFSLENLSCLALCMYLSQIVGAVGEGQYFQSAMRSLRYCY